MPAYVFRLAPSLASLPVSVYALTGGTRGPVMASGTTAADGSFTASLAEGSYLAVVRGPAETESAVVGVLAYSADALPPLVVDGTLVREGVGGPVYRSVSYNITVLPNIYTTAQTLTAAQLDTYFSSAIRPNSLTRLRAYAPPATSGITWDQQLATLDVAVNTARKYGQRLVLCFTAWGTIDQTADAFHPNTAWVTGQSYLASVSGSTSYETWVKTVVARYAGDATVSVYDLCNEPADGGSNTAAFKTWFDTTRGWIKAIDPDALTYVGISTVGAVGGLTPYETIQANQDLTGSHVYNSYGFLSTGYTAVTGSRVLAKPQFIDEVGVWAKAFYGASGDPDLDDTGWPAVDYLAQGKLVEQQTLSMLSLSDVMGVCLYSYMDSNGGSWSDALGHYEPPNESLARKVVREVSLAGDPFSADTLPQVPNGSWIDAAQALRFAPGATLTVVHERAANVDITTLPAAPAAGRFNGWGTFQFAGAQYADLGRWKLGVSTSSHFFAVVPTALPGAGAFGYLVAPQTAVGSLAIRLNSAGKVELIKYAAATTGTIIGTSSNAVTLNAANVLSVVWNTSSGAWELNLNGVRTAGTTTGSLTSSNARWGAAADATNGFTGHLLQAFMSQVEETAYNRGKATAYLSRKYQG